MEGEIPAGLPADLRAQKRIVQADVLCRLRQFQRAQPLLEDASRLILGDQRGLAAHLAFTRGRCTTNPEAANEYFSSAARLAHGTDEFIEAAGLLNVGFTLLQAERYDAAISVFLGGLTVTASPLLQNRMFGNLGFAYAQLGDWKRAISFSERAAKIAEKIDSKEAQEKWLIDLGKAHFALWEFADAEKSYLDALAVARGLADRNNTALCFHNLALLALRHHDVSKADNYRLQGEALSVDGERLHFALDAARIAEAQERLPDAERMFRELLPHTERDQLLRFQVQRDLGRVYWKEKRIADADRTFRDGIATAEAIMAGLKRPEYRMSFMDQDPFYDSYIQFLVAENRASEALKVAEQSRAQVLATGLTNDNKSSPSVSIPALQALARRSRKVILAYSMTDEKTFLWVITPSRFQLLEVPGQHQISSQIVAFNQEIQDHRNIEDCPSGRLLYQELIQPAESLFAKASEVVIIPSKLLSIVNFEALIVPSPQPHYWIEDVDVQVAGSLALLSSGTSLSGSRSRMTKKLLALGAPVEASKDFPALKYAPEEMLRVQGHFSNDERVVVSGEAATPQAYRANHPAQFRFIHLDTHGVSSDLNPLDSAIILSPGKDRSYKLYAQEIKDITLHADLVTISACYGAGTRWYQGEGIVGLAWAFLRAGAHQVIAALWEVDDASSPQLMDDFYRELVQGKSAAEALRDAKLKMLHSPDFHRHPYYWASLQLYTGS